MQQLCRNSARLSWLDAVTKPGQFLFQRQALLFGLAPEMLPCPCRPAAYRDTISRAVQVVEAWPWNPPIDDPINTRGWGNYGTFAYFPGRGYPQFGTSKPVPDKVASLSREGWVVMQDLCVFNWVPLPGAFMFNHGEGPRIQWQPTNNPSLMYRVGGPSGANLMFGDGHARWYPFGELEDVGRMDTNIVSSFYSVLP